MSEYYNSYKNSEKFEEHIEYVLQVYVNKTIIDDFDKLLTHYRDGQELTSLQKEKIKEYINNNRLEEERNI